MSEYFSAVSSIIKRQLKGNNKILLSQNKKYPSLIVTQNNLTLNTSHINKYKDICGYNLSSSLSSSPSSSSSSCNIPLMYPAMLCSKLQMKLMTNEQFPFPLLGLVHLSNSIEQYDHINPSSKVKIEISLNDKVILHEKGYCCEIFGKIYSENDNKLLWKTTLTILHRTKVVNNNNNDNNDNNDNNNDRIIYESQIKQSDVENTKEIERWSLSSDLGRKYASVSGDYNPIHLSAPSAYLFGFRNGAIIHGMWTKARTLATLMPPIESLVPPNDGTPIASVYTEFKTPLFIPSTAALCSLSSTKNNHSVRIFEVKGTQGDCPPYMRGSCSWVN